MSSPSHAARPTWTAAEEEPEGSKEELNLRRSARGGGGDDEPYLAIIKVGKPGHVPKGITPRARMGAQIFTALVTNRVADRLSRDPEVVSVSASRRMYNP